MKRLEFTSVLSEEEFLQAQAAGDFNTKLTYDQYVVGCHNIDALLRQQREALDPFDRAILEERMADFQRRRQPRAA